MGIKKQNEYLKDQTENADLKIKYKQKMKELSDVENPKTNDWDMIDIFKFSIVILVVAVFFKYAF